jgi:hypothetical protein
MAALASGIDLRVSILAPESGAKTSSTPQIFQFCEGVSLLRGKAVNHGSVRETYRNKVPRIPKQIAL